MDNLIACLREIQRQTLRTNRPPMLVMSRCPGGIQPGYSLASRLQGKITGVQHAVMRDAGRPPAMGVFRITPEFPKPEALVLKFENIHAEKACFIF